MSEAGYEHAEKAPAGVMSPDRLTPTLGDAATNASSHIVRVDETGITLSQRTIPWPVSVSREAREALVAASLRPSASFPDTADVSGWHRLIAQVNAGMTAGIPPETDPSLTVTSETLDGVAVHRAAPVARGQSDRRLYIDIHGGGLVFGAGAFCRAGAVREAKLHRVEVLAIDYRTPPDHCYPAALDDCLTAYAAEVRRRGAQNIIVGGASAGGYLTAALLLRAKDEGLPMPRATLLMSPRADMTESGDTVATLMDIDPVLKGSLAATATLYAGDHDQRHPYLSPLFGNLSGFPPTLLQSGTRDLYLSNTVRLHRALRAAGVAAELHVFEAMPHGRFFGGAPEDTELDRELARFVAAHWGNAA